MLTSALLVVIFIAPFPRAAIVAELLFDSVILRPVLLDPMRNFEEGTLIGIVDFQNIQAVDIRDELRSVYPVALFVTKFMFCRWFAVRFMSP